MLPLKKILAPTDFSEPSYAALDHAVELAAHFDAELCLLHVVPFSSGSPADFTGMTAVMTAGPSDAERREDARRLLHEVAATRVPPSLTMRYEVKMGYADKEIACLAAAENCDLLVIATHGLSGWRHMVFGSVAEAIVRQARCPVLTVHATPIAEEATPAGISAAGEMKRERVPC